MRLKHLPIYAILCVSLFAPAAARAEAPPAERLDMMATSWQQLSAEYEALCLQTYADATQELTDHVASGNYDRSGGRPVLRTLAPDTNSKWRFVSKPLAVVLDLDETVIDNSGFQVWNMGREYTDASWKKWVEFQGMTPAAQTAVPGAVEFIKAMEAQGVDCVYITNRDVTAARATIEVLRGYGVSMAGIEKRLLLDDRSSEKALSERMLSDLGVTAQSPEGQRIVNNGSKKERRRLEVQKTWHVIGYCGDNLYDFPVMVSRDVKEDAPRMQLRAGQVTGNLGHWGRDWFMLPNPMYGDWPTRPETKMLDMLTDYGFGEWLKANP